MQLEVGRGALELRAGRERVVEIDAVLAQRVGERDALSVVQGAQVVLVGHRARRRGRAEERPAEAGALFVGPVDETHGDRRRPLSAIRRSTSTAATTLRQPSSQPPFGTESI